MLAMPRGASVEVSMDLMGTDMDARLGIALTVLAAAGMTGCATGSNPFSRLGWTSPPVEATAKVRSNCEASVQTLHGRPDYDTALHACLQAMTRQAKS